MIIKFNDYNFYGYEKGFHMVSYPNGILLLYYVDDIMFFKEGSIYVAQNLLKLLDLSMLQLIQEKSIFMGFVLPMNEVHYMWALGTMTGTLPMRYLGLPSSRAQMSTLN